MSNADKTFTVLVETKADPSGIRQTEADLDSLKQKAAAPSAATLLARQESLRAAGAGPLPEEPLKEAAAASEELAAGSLLAGANLTRARQEAIVLARELATGGNVTRTLGSLLGSLGLPITLATVAGLTLNRVISSAGDEALKLQQDIGKEYDELIKKTREWSTAARTATSDADVLRIGKSAIPEIEKVRDKLKEMQQEELGFWKKVFDASVAGPTFGAKPFADALKAAQIEQQKVVDATVKSARSAVEQAQAYEDAFDERKAEPFIQAIEEATNEIDGLKTAQDALNPSAQDYVQRWVEIGEQIAGARRQLAALVQTEQKRQEFQRSVDDENKSRAKDLFKGPVTFQKEQEQELREHLAEQAAARAELRSIETAGGPQTEQESARVTELQRVTGKEANRRFEESLERRKLLREQALAESLIPPGETDLSKSLGSQGAKNFEDRSERLRQLTESGRQLPSQPGPGDFKEIVVWLQKLYQQWQ